MMLTIEQLREDKARYEELLLQKGQELANLQMEVANLQGIMGRLWGAHTYVVENLNGLIGKEEADQRKQREIAEAEGWKKNAKVVASREARARKRKEAKAVPVFIDGKKIEGAEFIPEGSNE